MNENRFIGTLGAACSIILVALFLIASFVPHAPKDMSYASPKYKCNKSIKEIMAKYNHAAYQNKPEPLDTTTKFY